MSRSASSRTRLAAGAAAVCLAGGLLTAVGSPAAADHPPTAPPKDPVAIGTGGAVSSVDPNATQIGIEVLRAGGNATDAAVATAAALGVTEPYSAGIGGGGFFVHYDADSGEVETIDGREAAPMAMPSDAFIDPATGQPYAPFFPNLVTSGVSVGVPGTASTWETALDNWGSMSLRKALKPATKLADKGFVVDETFHQQTNDNAERFAAIESTADLYLPDGAAPAVGSVFRNPDLADTYELLGRNGPDAILEGAIAEEIVDAVQNPPITGESDLPVPPGFMEVSDLDDYEVREPDPTLSDYRGLDIYGMAPPSSGGSTVGEALNILETTELSPTNLADALHRYLEASALAFADRGGFLGDSEFVDVPLDELLSDGFAAERACQIDPDAAATKPVAAGAPDGEYETACEQAAPAAQQPDSEGPSTTHLTVVDRWGNVVAYTLTIEQTGGSGIVVPGRGFILNNELTDFSTVFNEADPNRIQPGKRPRSSMSPTIVLKDDEPWLALGSPGGSTIITTVLQTMVNRIDLEMPLPEALAAPRASQRNTTNVSAEPDFVGAYGAILEPLGHSFATTAEIGAATAIELLPDGTLVAAAEPERRGGGDAGVVRPGGE